MIVLDIETTGLSPIRDAIVEIGIVEINGNIINPIFSRVCKEPRPISPNDWIFQNSTLNYEEVLNSIDFIRIKNYIQKLVRNEWVACYNSEFDLSFLRHRGICFNKVTKDPMLILTNILKIPHYYYGVKYPKFQEAWDYFFPEWEYVEKHRALDDAIHEAILILEIKKKLGINVIP